MIDNDERRRVAQRLRAMDYAAISESVICAYLDAVGIKGYADWVVIARRLADLIEPGENLVQSDADLVQSDGLAAGQGAAVDGHLVQCDRAALLALADVLGEQTCTLDVEQIARRIREACECETDYESVVMSTNSESERSSTEQNGVGRSEPESVGASDAETIDRLESMLCVREDRIAELKSENAELRRTAADNVNRLTGDVDRRDETIRELSRKTAELERELDVARESAQNSADSADRLAATCVGLKNHIAELDEVVEQQADVIEMHQSAEQELLDRIAAMEPRLMPEGIEWPRFEDGEPVRFEDATERHKRVTGFWVSNNGYVELNPDVMYNEHADNYRPGERVKRPEPEVLGADGVPIRVGETVYGTHVGIGRAAFEVVEVDGGNVALRNLDSGSIVYDAAVRNYTHTPPDSWERIEEDARRLDIDLDGESGCDYPRMSCVRDLVARCKRLAGVE